MSNFDNIDFSRKVTNKLLSCFQQKKNCLCENGYTLRSFLTYYFHYSIFSVFYTPQVFWHSTAHMLGEAMERIYGGNLCYGPPIEEGFYYDMHHEGDAVNQVIIVFLKMDCSASFVLPCCSTGIYLILYLILGVPKNEFQVDYFRNLLTIGS